MLFNYNLIKEIKLFRTNYDNYNLPKLFYFHYLYIYQFTLFRSTLNYLPNFLYLTTKVFFKKRNFNKLYINNDYLFLTPGIVLKFNNLFKKNLKSKTNL